MASEIEKVEERIKSFTGQLQTECGILERLVYKHKNQHRRCSYFQYLLKVRRDLKLVKLANLEEILDASFLVINGNRPKQKVQLLESLKRRRSNVGKYNFRERLLGVTRLLSEMVEPLLKASMEISTLLAQSFFMKFSLTTLAVLARIRVLVQQMLLDAVHVYNTVTSLSQSEQTVKLNQDGFEVFREYYPRKEEATTLLECIWQTDKYVLVERTNSSETNSQDKDDREDVPLKTSKIQYENIEVLLGVDESGTTTVTEHVSSDPTNAEQKGNDPGPKKNEEKQILSASDTSGASNANIISSENVFTNSSIGTICETKNKDGLNEIPDIKSNSFEAGLLASSSSSSLSNPPKLKNETKKRKVAFVSVKPPVPSTTNESRFDLNGTQKNGGNKEDPFFNFLTGGNKSSLF
ncbi:hypothetical protein BUALT_Bualt18G0063800 [Buddleja alternifolia]|uniref:Nucleolus and neural progenitor protein-like N-terminal domain-containing protein n=1 Tax=Buddleja alternifolia TaxID=168488 RepID=A0AAV6W470_9LAMI|nr:hypothetical protein BUALT_Bualt18G0063800 [Buddleja alternifolia]